MIILRIRRAIVTAGIVVANYMGARCDWMATRLAARQKDLTRRIQGGARP